jgi:hypothetical protein
MSWGAHQFEIYAVQVHLPRKMRGRVSFLGVWPGDFTPDFLSKFWCTASRSAAPAHRL